MSNKTITTKHTEIGYACNVAIVEKALHEFGIQDCSAVQHVVAANIWSEICTQPDVDLEGASKHWGTPQILRAIANVQWRINHMKEFVEKQLAA